MTAFIKMADVEAPGTGKTYRQINMEKQHAIPVGTLIELDTGVRLFVVHQYRDCDGEPLYCLSVDKDDTIQHDPSFFNHRWLSGYQEDCLEVVGGQTLRISWDDNGQERELFLVDKANTDTIKLVYAAANEVHIPIGPGAFDCKFECGTKR